MSATRPVPSSIESLPEGGLRWGQRGFIQRTFDHHNIEKAHPEQILEWALNSIENLAIATSFQSSGLVILHIARSIRPEVPVLFLDTGFHFPETLEFRDRIATEWGINVMSLRGTHGSAKQQAKTYGPGLYKSDPDKCCFINKVEPLQRALAQHEAWVSGLRRDQSPSRAGTQILEPQMLPDDGEVLKIHPLAHWTRDDVADYVTEHNIPTHPLLEKGFASIGCWPCTRAIRSEEDERAGRWEGFTKTECGIHSFGKPHGPMETEAEQ
jgi:phosphoadenosine phosphosulfate reductase